MPGAEGEGSAFGYPRSRRLRQGKDIRGLFRRGKRKRTDHLDVFFLPSPASRSRLGLVVPRHRHAVVERNRLRRRLREIGRIEVLPRLDRAGASLDVLVRARGEAYDARFAELLAEMVNVTESLCSGRSSSD